VARSGNGGVYGFVLAFVLILGVAAPAASQVCFRGGVADESDEPCRFAAPRWSGELASLGANALLGGLTAGLVRHFSGGSFAEGFTRGVLGGSLVYAGKRVAAERFGGAGLIGRELAAAGASTVRNAGAGLRPLDRLSLPVGPVWLELRRSRPVRVGARVDPAALAWLLYGVVEDELELDLAESLSSGTALFRTKGKLLSFGDDSVHAGGVTNAGIMFLADVPAYGAAYARRAAAHERIHVLQEDQLAILWTDPVAASAIRRIPALDRFGRHLVVNLTTELFRVLAPLFATHEDRPWELEAIFHAR
jgi:hypothetical protein